MRSRLPWERAHSVQTVLVSFGKRRTGKQAFQVMSELRADGRAIGQLSIELRDSTRHVGDRLGSGDSENSSKVRAYVQAVVCTDQSD